MATSDTVEGSEMANLINRMSNQSKGEEPSKDNYGFFPPVQIQGDRWNKLYPYRLLIVDANKGFQKPESEKIEAINASNTSSIFLSKRDIYEYNFPISPQQLSISSSPADVVTATAGGVVLERGGNRFKNISLAGTFGVNPSAASLATKGVMSDHSFAQVISGSVSALNTLGNTVVSLGETIGSMFSSKTKTVSNTGVRNNTGYESALLLEQFLERYNELSKKPENNGWRLVLDIPKQNQSFLVALQDYSVMQGMDSPLEYKFKLSLKAFKRIVLNAEVSKENKVSPFDPSFLSKLYDAVDRAGQALYDFRVFLQAVTSDANRVLNIFMKLSDYAGAASGVVETADSVSAGVDSTWKLMMKEFGANSNGKSAYSNSSSQLNSVGSRVNGGRTSGGDSDSGASNGTPQQQEREDNAQQQSSYQTLDDISSARDDIVRLAGQFANEYGVGSPDWNALNNELPPKQRLTEVTLEEYEMLRKLYDVIGAINNILATNEMDSRSTLSSMEFVSGLANESGIPFNVPTSKILAPVPFGLNIEQIAARYLQDAQRWQEITTLNNLRSPYIDEEGFIRPLTSNAVGRRLNISDATNIYTGQKITIRSSNAPQTTRYIIDVEKINSTNYLITVDGQDNLDIYKTASGANIKAYLPATTNSQNQIWIPSNEAPAEDIDSKGIPALVNTKMVGLSKVDLLQTEDGDVALDSLGDFRLSAGMTNLIQAIRMKFSVVSKNLLTHLNYGAGVDAGIETSELSPQDLYKQIDDTIKLDSRFAGINTMQVTKEGTTLRMNITVKLANGKGTYPLSFVIR